MEFEYFGQVYLDDAGIKRLKLFDPDRPREDLQLYDPGDRVIMVIKTFYRERSKKQNNVMHWYFGAIAKETGHTLQEIKDMMKTKFLQEPMKDGRGNEVVDSDTGEIEMIVLSTRKLPTVRAVEFCEQVRDWARRVLNLELPVPDSNWKLNFK